MAQNKFAARANKVAKMDGASAKKQEVFKSLATFLQVEKVEKLLVESNVETDFNIDMHSAAHFSRVIGFALGMIGYYLADTFRDGFKTIVLHGNAGVNMSTLAMECCQTAGAKIPANIAALVYQRSGISANNGNWHNRVIAVFRELGVLSQSGRSEYRVNVESPIYLALKAKLEL